MASIQMENCDKCISPPPQTQASPSLDDFLYENSGKFVF